MKRMDFQKDELIIREGDIGAHFYVLLKGSADIVKQGQIVANIKDGCCFGELALMHDVPRAASVRCALDCVVYAIGRDEFRCLCAAAQNEGTKASLAAIKRVKIFKTLYVWCFDLLYAPVKPNTYSLEREVYAIVYTM